MATGTYLVDGVALDDVAGRWRLENASKLPAAANRRVASLDLPYRDGVVAVRQGMGTGVVGVSVVVMGAEASGGDLGVLEQRRSVVARLLGEARSVRWAPGVGVARTVDVVESAVSEPDLRGMSAAVVSAALTVQPFWHEDAVIVTNNVALAAGTVEFPQLAGCTGRLNDAVVRVLGPFSTLTVTSPVDGSGAVFSAPLAASTYLYLDTVTFRAWTSSSATAWSGGTARLADFPAAGPLTVWPTLAGDPMSMPVRLQVAGTGFTAASRIAIRSRRWFL